MELAEQSGARDGDELRPLTSLFADVVGSTSLGERLDPSEVKALIGECVTRMCEAVERYGGHVGAYMGDGIAAFFGLRVALEDDIERAARAALEIRRVILAYAKEVDAAWGISDFSVRVGINHGRVGIGEVGSADPQLLALGDSVNVAARLQSAAAPGSIVVGPTIADSLGGRYSLLRLGPVKVKGREEAVDAFELADFETNASARPEGSFVGRLAELKTLDDILADLSEGRGQVVAVVGEGGIGKTRLLEECRRRRAHEATWWLRGCCDTIDASLPYEPFVQPLRTWLGIDGLSTAIETRIRLSARGRALLGVHFDDVAPHLARLLGVNFDTRLDHRLDGFPQEVLVSGLYSAYSDWLCALGHESTVVLALDNLDTASEATAEFASAVISATKRAPVLVIMATRRAPDQPGWSVRVRALAEFSERATELVLKPLCKRESEALVASLSKGKALNDRLSALVIERAEGNPLFIEELVSTVSDGTDAADLPLALESLLLARIDGLSRETKSVLQAAAVLGRVFRRDVLRDMGITDGIDAAIGSLLRCEIIHERGRKPLRFEFRHGLLRDAALATLTPYRRRRLHGAAATAMERHPLGDERESESLARHYLASGDVGHAMECLEELADRMCLVFRYEEAVELFARCLRQIDASNGSLRVRIARKEAEALVALREFDGALSLLQEAESNSADTIDRAALRLVRARALLENGKFAETREVLDGVLRIASASPVWAQARVLSGRLALECGDASRAVHEISSLNIDAFGPEVAFEIASLRGGSALMSGDIDLAETWALRAQGFAEQTGSLSNQLAARRRVALVCLVKGYVREAFELTRSVYDEFVSLNYAKGQLEAGFNLVHLCSLVGALDQGVRVAETLLKQPLGPDWRPMLQANLAGLRLELGDCVQAERDARELLDAQQSTSPSWVQLSAHLVIAGALIGREMVSAARAELAKAADAAAIGRPGELALVQATQAEAAMLEGDVEVGLSFAQAARRSPVPTEKVVRLRLNRVCSFVEAMNGDGAAATSLETDAVDARRMGLRLEEARALVSLGSLDPARSEHHFAEAERIFEECGCRRGLVELEEARRGVLIATGS